MSNHPSWDDRWRVYERRRQAHLAACLPILRTMNDLEALGARTCYTTTGSPQRWEQHLVWHNTEAEQAWTHAEALLASLQAAYHNPLPDHYGPPRVTTHEVTYES